MSIYQHFRPEEREFIDRILGWQRMVEERYSPKLTDFLDPREQYIAQTIIGKHNLCQISFFGGYAGSERKRALIFPDYFDPQEEDYEISLFEILYPDKFVQLTHPQVLGSLMGLGIRRGKFGDILLKNGRVQFFAAKEIGEYLRLHYHQAGKVTVSLEERKLEEVLPIEEKMEEVSLTVSSLRLDAVLSAVLRFSREKALRLIKEGRVKVNWRTEETPSFPLEEGDLISARGFGRIKMISIGEQTKKEKWRITIGKIK